MLRLLLVISVTAGCNQDGLVPAGDLAAIEDLAVELERDLAMTNKSPPADLSSSDLATQLTSRDLFGFVSKRVFVSSAVYTANLGGLAGADAKCQMLADNAQLGGTYQAWLSDHSATPLTRMARSKIPYALIDGSVIAVDFNELIGGSLRHAINITEVGGPPPKTTGCLGSGPHRVWSDTRNDGTIFSGGETCGEWTDTNSNMSAWGDPTSQGHWSHACNGGNSPSVACGTVNAIYCFEQ